MYYPSARGGRRRSWNHGRYFVIFERCATEACSLQVAASGLLSGATQRSSTQSFTLYAISRAAVRSSTSLSASVHAEPSLRGYENLRAASSDASALSKSAFTSAMLFPFGMANGKSIADVK